MRASRSVAIGFLCSVLLAGGCRDAASPLRPGAGRAAADDSSAVNERVPSYSTYLGGGGDDGGFGIAIDTAGNVYVVGYTFSANFPTSPGAVQRTRGGAAQDAFVAKLNPTTGLVYSTYLGGPDPDPVFGDAGTAIAVDARGDAYVTGYTSSTAFPTTPGAWQTVFGGVRDAFVAELNPAGTALVYSTYLGGGGSDAGVGIAVDRAGTAYVTGSTSSANYPTTPGAEQTAFGGVADGFVTALNSTGAGLVYSTYLGGSGGDGGYGIAIDTAGRAYVTGSTASADFPTTPGVVQAIAGGGSDAFIAALNSTGSALVYATYLGGADADAGNGIAVDAAGQAYVTGNTSSANFPTTPGVFQAASGGGSDAFIVGLNPTGSALVFSTYLGGNDVDRGFGIAVDAAGTLYVTGATSSTNFPATPALIPLGYGGGNDAFITAVHPSGSRLVYSTYLGGNYADGGFGIAVDAGGNAYVTGYTSSTNFPTTPGAVQLVPGGINDAFVTRITHVAAP